MKHATTSPDGNSSTNTPAKRFEFGALAGYSATGIANADGSDGHGESG
jgi:predicted O-methyltransferase YrrM